MHPKAARGGTTQAKPPPQSFQTPADMLTANQSYVGPDLLI